MTEELKISIEELYKTFSRYPFRSTIDGCPCCVSDTDKEKLHTKPLRQLEEEDISRYAFKAMSTWGDSEDFKYYLPRIFELLSTTDFIVDTFVVLGKLEYAGWKNWEKDEIGAIRTFLLAWWSDLIKYKSYFDKEAFIEIYKLIDDINIILDRWKISFEDESFKNYIEFVFDYYYDLTNKNSSLKGIDSDALKRMLIWVNDKKSIIESGFFHFEKTNPEFAEKISNTLYIIDRTPTAK